jgi:O-antigen/teichoic acid export membrane protein
MGYFKNALKGLSWMGALRIVTRLLAFGRIAILARILVPAQFGLFGVAALALSLLETFTETGINIFLIQLKKDINEYINTAWVVSIIRGFLISIVIFFSAPLVSGFFGFPDALPLLRLISIVPLIRGFINPSIVKLQKDLKFNQEFKLRGVIYLTDALIVVTVALTTRSAISLIWGLVGSSLLEVVLSFIYMKPRPTWLIERKKIKQIIERGKWVTGYRIFDYLYQNLDDVIVGKLLGVTPLGLYQVAYKISSLPVSEVAEVFSKVTFPIYVKITADEKRLKKAFLKTAKTSSLIMVLMGLTIVIFPREIVLIILGENWLSTVPILRVLAVFGVFKGIVGIPQSFFLAKEKQEYVTIVTLVTLVTLVISIFPLVNRYGTIGAAYSAVLGSVVGLLIAFYYTTRMFKNEKK